MLKRGVTYLTEWARCTRHNVMHLQHFRISYCGGLWQARDGELSMRFPYYPYLAFHDIEGYLNNGRWRPERGMTVIDAGGCNGEFSLYASKCVGPEGRVLMLEPDAANIARARKVFELNGNPSNIQIVPAGLWKERGTVRFRAGSGATSAIDSTAPSEPAATAGDVVEIPTFSLASLVEEFKLDRLDMVKMDIEGAELDAISVADQLPPSMKPRYSIASYHIVNGHPTAEALPELFGRLGYHCKSGYPNHLTTWAAPAPIEA